MNIKHTTLTIALSFVLASSAQAGVKDWLKDKKNQIQGHTQKAEPAPTNLPGVEVKGEREDKPEIDKAKAVKSGVTGCAIGVGLISLLAKEVSASTGCMVGGAVGFGWSYKKQVKDARAVEAAAKEAGMTATVKTKQQVDEKGKQQEVMSSLVVSYDAADMEALAPKTTAMLDKLATLTSKSKNTLTIRFEGVRACQVPMVELQKRGALERHTVVNACGKGDNEIVVSPAPDTDL